MGDIQMFFQSHWANLEGIELHSFGDASPKGYGAVVYICKPNPDGTSDIIRHSQD